MLNCSEDALAPSGRKARLVGASCVVNCVGRKRRSLKIESPRNKLRGMRPLLRFKALNWGLRKKSKSLYLDIRLNVPVGLPPHLVGVLMDMEM